ncbi:MAG: PilZ domain-containing protein [Pseudomonadota bacterium]
MMSDRLAAIAKDRGPTAPIDVSKPLRSKGEKRTEPREAVFRPGKVYTSTSNFVRCVIQDVSANGARIRAEVAHDLPEIVIIKFDQTGIAKKARVVWQNECDAGLLILGVVKSAKSSRPRLKRKPLTGL